MNILIISGFLGAGKTTFIKEMCRRTGREFVVMENEFGEADVDSSLLRENTEMNIWELTEGCICCNMKANFAESVLAIESTLSPDILIVEPSGVGMLSNVISNLKKIQYERIGLLSPITIIDAESALSQSPSTMEIFADQLRTAGKIIFSKTDLSGGEVPQSAVDLVRGLNPTAEIVTDHYSAMPRAWWEDILATRYDGQKLADVKPSSADAPNLSAITLKGSSVPSPSLLVRLLEDLIRGRFGRICRAKGFVRCGGETLRFDVVDRRYSITGFDGSADSAVFFVDESADSRMDALREALGATAQKSAHHGHDAT